MDIQHYWQPDPNIAQVVTGDSSIGSDTFLTTVSPNAEDLFLEILKELKIMNVHLASLSGEEVTSKDIGDSV